MPRGSRAACTALALAFAVGLPADTHADVVGHGPTTALGFVSKLDEDMTVIGLGWRFRLGPGQTLAGWAGAVGTDLTFVVEPMAAAIVGDQDSGEAQVVPMLHLRPRAWLDRKVVPYLEAGIGLIYTGLEDLRLGSNLLFSDNAGLGLAFALPEGWQASELAVGYRFRHASHAGVFGQPNSGFNTHYLTIALEF